MFYSLALRLEKPKKPKIAEPNNDAAIGTGTGKTRTNADPSHTSPEEVSRVIKPSPIDK